MGAEYLLYGMCGTHQITHVLLRTTAALAPNSKTSRLLISQRHLTTKFNNILLYSNLPIVLYSNLPIVLYSNLPIGTVKFHYFIFNV